MCRRADIPVAARRLPEAGFTLIEVMVAVAVLGILSSIALPAWTDLLQQVRRHDGRALLQTNAQRLQRCFTLEGVYDAGCVLRRVSEEGHYTLVDVRTATTYAIEAVPLAGGPQANDADCASLTYTHTGASGATGASPELCW